MFKIFFPFFHAAQYLTLNFGLQETFFLLVMKSFPRKCTHTSTHTQSECRLQNMAYEYERASFNNNGKTRVLPAVNGTKWRKAEQHRILSSLPQNKHSMIALAMDDRDISLLSCVSLVFTNINTFLESFSKINLHRFLMASVRWLTCKWHVCFMTTIWIWAPYTVRYAQYGTCGTQCWKHQLTGNIMLTV